MEIIKQNETYRLSDTTSDGWVMTGQANKSADGNLSVNFSVSKPGELAETVGDFNYGKYTGSDKVNISCNVAESDRDSFTAYSDKVVDTIIDYFNK